MITDILIYAGYFLVLILGVLSHFFKKKVKGETLADIKQYFKSNFKSTIATLIASIVLYSALLAAGDLGIFPMFFAGYTADSIFNRAEASVKK